MQRLLALKEHLLGRSYDSAMSLPGQLYSDPDVLQLEKQRLFFNQWVCVGRNEEVNKPGDFFTFDLCGEPVLITCGEDRAIRAFSNLCQHRGTVLVQGSGNSNRLICPYHHWSYDLTGQLVHAPHMDAHQTFKPQNCRLPELKCEIWAGFIFVSLGSDVAPLAAQLAPLNDMVGAYHLEGMNLRYLVDEIWPVNWKCLLENYMEGYHLSALHRKTLHQVNPTRLCEHFPAGGAYFGYRVGFSARLPDERIGHADLTESELDSCIMFAIPPGFAVGVGSDYSSFLCLRPDAVDRVNVKIGLIFHGDTWTESQVNDAVTLFQQTMDEDKAVLLRLQRGLTSRFHRSGPLAPQHLEGTIWDFYHYLAQHLDQREDGKAVS